MVSVVSSSTVGTTTIFTYMGKSTDEKPVSTNASKFVEMDTGDEYFFDGDENGWSVRADKYLSSISVTTLPTKTQYYEGEEFDPTGMVVKATYTDNSQATITNYEIECASPLDHTYNTIRIIYKENGRTRKTFFSVTVKGLLTDIEFHTFPNVTEYNVGDQLDLTGTEIDAFYNDGLFADVTSATTFTPVDGATLTASDTTLVATYIENGITKSNSIPLTINEE